VKREGKRHSGERGASLLLVVVLLFGLLGVVGLALDGGNLYVTKQRAQAAADAAAQAGVMDLYRGNGSGAASTSATAYAGKNGFSSSQVTVAFPDCTTLPWCNGHVTLSGDSPDLIQVTITKSVPSTFLQVVGISASTVNAVGTAAITIEPQPVPILVLHPTASGSFSKNGSNTIQICGGPPRSIQVNSSSTSSINISGASGTVDLSHAGPLDAGDCVAGTGSDFANVGVQNPYPGTLLLGTKPGQYISPASGIQDPLLSVAEPSVQPAAAPVPASYTGAAATAHNCPADGGCNVYSPGYYANGISVKSKYAIFKPGIYWINHNGFILDSNSIVRMASAAADMSDPTTGWTKEVLIYNNPQSPVNSTKDIISINSNSGQVPSGQYTCAPGCPTADCPNGGNCFNGTPTTSAYKGILFFQSRATATTLTHTLQGGGGLTLKGTIYLTHTAARIASDGKYQSLSLQGNSGGTTKVQGEIIVDELSLGGTSVITMNLDSAAVFPVRQVALVH
jgi:Flp pilus assembly protein TadG